MSSSSDTGAGTKLFERYKAITGDDIYRAIRVAQEKFNNFIPCYGMSFMHGLKGRSHAWCRHPLCPSCWHRSWCRIFEHFESLEPRTGHYYIRSIGETRYSEHIDDAPMKRFKSNCGSYRLLGYGLNFMELWNCPDEELWYFPIGLFYAENPVQERGDIDTLGRLRVEDKNGYMIQINRIKVDDPVQAVEVLIEELMPWWLLEGFNGLSRDHIDSFSDGRRFFRSVKP